MTDAAIAANEALLPFVIVELPLEELRISFCTPGTIIRVDDLVPFLHGAQVFMSIAKHLVQGAIGEVLRLGNVVKADADGSVLEDRTEELLALLQGLLGTLAFRDVFRQGDEVLWLACSVPEQLKSPVATTMRPSRRMKRCSYSSFSRLPWMSSAYRFAPEARSSG